MIMFEAFSSKFKDWRTSQDHVFILLKMVEAFSKGKGGPPDEVMASHSTVPLKFLEELILNKSQSTA